MVVNLKNSTVSKIMLLLLLSGLMVFAFEFNVKPAKAWTGTVYIRADGRIDPSQAPIFTSDNVTYILTDNIYGSIVVERNNITINGNNYVLQGQLSGNGIELLDRQNVRITNIQIKYFQYGVRILSSMNITIDNNKITGCEQCGISVGYCSDCKIYTNNIFYGGNSIGVGYSLNNDIYNNNITKSRLYIGHSLNNRIYKNRLNLCGIWVEESSSNMIAFNELTASEFDGITIVRSSNVTLLANNITASERYGIWLEDSDNNVLLANNLTANYQGIRISYSENNTLKNNIIYGNICNFEVIGSSLSDFINDIEASNTINGKPIQYIINKKSFVVPSNAGYVALVNCTDVIVTGANLTDVCNAEGILLAFTQDSIITANKIANNKRGIWIFHSSNNTISNNDVTANIIGIENSESVCNSFIANNISENSHGIILGGYSNIVQRNNITCNYNYGIVLGGTDNMICSNDIIRNNRGISIERSFNNIIFLNNFIENSVQVYVPYGGYFNSWDNGYPCGGNYWSDFREKYPYAKELNGSGLWDTPYVIDENNQDRYPLMYPHSTQTYKLTITATSGGTTDPKPGVHTYADEMLVEVTAIPNINYTLAYWELDGANIGSDNPIEVLMDTNHTLNAVFTPIKYYELTILTTFGGTTNPQPGTYTYADGMTIEVTAIPNVGFFFEYWLFDGEIRTENPITIIMDENHALEAHFIDNIEPEISEPWQDPPLDNVQPFQNVTVWVNVTDYGIGIRNVTLWYSIDNGTNWNIINMTELSIPSNTTITCEATIPGYENCTWVSYKIIAYDNAGNNATKDNNGFYYRYHVVPEYTTITLTLLILITTLITSLVRRTKFPK